ncbi:TPA: alpha-ketoacid dehydrogenase subunit beta, partial [Candidatus Bathyarchaeota archaeon]|nr:alpha-ketoacid dehydrogenase subunit beta [Candidatus Bathyarchaeota archaeon]
GLLKAAIRDNNPVMFIEHKMIYNQKGPVPEEDYVIPFGVADIKREGTDVTVVAYSRMVYRALEAAEALAKEGISVEVIDPRTLVPLDEEAIIGSVKKTGRLVVVDEDYHSFGFSGEVVAIAAERALKSLESAPIRVATPNIPLPFNPRLEKELLPNKDKIVTAIKRAAA